MAKAALDDNNAVNLHPCFSVTASQRVGRIHLPVAPKCNVQCRYCNRKYDCVAESRPGVTSSVLSPEKALARLEFVLKKQPEVEVVGIAGPGDPLANPEETIRTFRLIRKSHPELSFCMSTNGLLLDKYLTELVEVGVSYITLTINSFKPEVVKNIYGWVFYEDQKYEGIEAAELLIERQKAALKALENKNVLCKVNVVYIPGINDFDVSELIEELSEYTSVACVNIMPFIPVEGSVFENRTAPERKEIQRIRNMFEPLIPQIRHCCQCRSDAVGLLHCSRSGKSDNLMNAIDTYERRAELLAQGLSSGMKIAVASSDGIRVDEHFGHASNFQIYKYNDSDFELSGNRTLDPFCCSQENEADPVERLSAIIKELSDCTVIVCSKIGIGPRVALESAGFYLIESDENIETILKLEFY